MGLAWILVLEVCKFVGRKHRRLIYIRAIGPLLVRMSMKADDHFKSCCVRALQLLVWLKTSLASTEQSVK